MKKNNSIEQLKEEGLITTAGKVPMPQYVTLNEVVVEYLKKEWVVQIEEYCNQQGILPLELIDFHRSKGKVAKKKDKAVNELKIENKSKANWRSDYINSKTGIK